MTAVLHKRREATVRRVRHRSCRRHPLLLVALPALAGAGLLLLLVALPALAGAGLLLLDREEASPTRDRASVSPPAPAVSVPHRELHVSPAGSDGAAGTAEEPFRTLEHALEALRPGSLLVVGDGLYQERLDKVDVRPGTPQRPILVRAAPGARPVLQGLLWLRDADHWDVSGLDVRWDEDNAGDEHMVKFQGGTGWRFADAELSGARSYAALLIAGGAERFTVSGLYVHDTHPTNDTNQDHLVYVNTDARGGIIEHCLLVNSENGRGIKVGPGKAGGAPVGGLDIRYNTFYNNLGPSNLQLSYGAHDVSIYRNIFVKSGEGSSSVTGYRLDGGHNVVHDNIGHESTGVVPMRNPRIRDLGGNRMRDPRLRDAESGDFRPTDPIALDHGAFAGLDAERLRRSATGVLMPSPLRPDRGGSP